MQTIFWAVVGGVLIAAECITPQFVLFFFGMGALINAVLVTLLSPLRAHVPLQLVLWIVTSSVSLAFLRRYAARWFRGERRDAAVEATKEAGEVATVVEEITPDRPGRIRYRGTTWRAECYEAPIAVGTTVTIIGKDSLTYTVTEGDLLGWHGEGKHEKP